MRVILTDPLAIVYSGILSMRSNALGHASAQINVVARESLLPEQG
jgi:hypothetical protein